MIKAAHQIAIEVGLENDGRLELSDFIVVVRVEKLGHVQGRGSIQAPCHCEHTLVAGGEVAVALRHGAEKLGPFCRVGSRKMEDYSSVSPLYFSTSKHVQDSRAETNLQGNFRLTRGTLQRGKMVQLIAQRFCFGDSTAGLLGDFDAIATNKAPQTTATGTVPGNTTEGHRREHGRVR